MKIKKKLKVIIPSAVLVVGIVLAVIGLAMGAKGDYVKSLELTDFEANVPSSGVFNLDINVSLADINIVCTNDVEEFNIKADNISKQFLDYSTTNNTFKLRYETKKWYQTTFIPGFLHKQGKINIYIPASLNFKDVQINSRYGSSELSYITAERIFIDCGTGSSNITNLTCDYVKIDNKGGGISCMNVDAAAADLTLRSGDTEFCNFVSESVKIENKFCDLTLSGIIKGNCSIVCSMGDVNATLYGNESDYNFNVLKGNVSVNNIENPQNKDGKYYFKTDCSMGEINFIIE